MSAPTWVDHLYSCQYGYPTGSMELSVKELSSWAQTAAYYQLLAHQLGKTSDLENLGQGAFQTTDGSVVVRKDWKVLLVNIAGLPAQFGVPPTSSGDVAVTVADVILGCWAGDWRGPGAASRRVSGDCARDGKRNRGTPESGRHPEQPPAGGKHHEFGEVAGAHLELTEDVGGAAVDGRGDQWVNGGQLGLGAVEDQVELVHPGSTRLEIGLHRSTLRQSHRRDRWNRGQE